MALDQLSECKGFDWDEGNREKNWFNHRVSDSETEEIFFNQPFIIGDDRRHSKSEPRHYALGQTNAGRKLFLAFTIRGDLIRVISARDMNRRESKEYDREESLR